MSSSLAPGSRIGSYEVLAPLGAGGMGEVFRARDSRLGRDVAIKGLPEAFAGNPERLARFEREARLLASLSHPNIAQIFGLEESGGRPHLVLELVEGESLIQRLARGAMPVREVLATGEQIAAAMEAAHERDIVHRDLKPGNIMLTPARVVKVLDFGLAKGGAKENASAPDLSASPTVALTATGAGVILGTAPYMSPEQARGHEADRRTDVWAFGCVLYECLSGRQAFSGDTVSDVIARVLEREPDWDAIPAAAPARLRALVRRCLTKDVEARPRDIGDLRRELAAIAADLAAGVQGRAAKKAEPSLAVLYFEHASDDEESAYFCTGITEDILTDLSKIRGLRVASRNAVARYRGGSPEIAQVAADLGVDAVLEGSVRRAGNRVRITAQLAAADGFHLWAERYDRTMEDVFAVQEEIAAAIAAAMKVALTPAETETIARARPQDVRAYDLYLRGRAIYDRYEPAAFRDALALMRQATEVDPDYALAWAGMADCYGQLAQWNAGPDTPEAFARTGLDAARRAIELNPKLPEAYKAEALCRGGMGDPAGARVALGRALDADPRFTPALINLAVDDFSRCDLAGAERNVRRVLEIDPQEKFALTWIAYLAIHTRRWEEARTAGERLAALAEDEFYRTALFSIRVMSCLEQGDLAGAEQVLRDAPQGVRVDTLRAAEALLHARRGESARAREILAGLGDKGLVVPGLVMATEASLRIDAGSTPEFLERRVAKDMKAVLARLHVGLHPLLEREPYAPRRLDATLVWPLEASMIDAARFRVFREVRIDTGLPEASLA